MTKKSSKKSFLVVLFLVLILALAIGYAAFSDTLTISGTANANGKFDLEFTTASGLVSAEGVDTTLTTATVSNDKNTLNVVVKDLAYPGAGAQFKAVIKNVGTAPAKIKALTPTNITGADSIKITGLDALTTSHGTIDVNGTCEVNFTVVWDPTKDLTNSAGDTVSFSLVIEYEQDTTDFAGTASHTDA